MILIAFLELCVIEANIHVMIYDEIAEVDEKCE